MWYVWYFDSVFSKRYVRVPGQRGFSSAAEAKSVAAKARSFIDYSYIVLPY